MICVLKAFLSSWEYIAELSEMVSCLCSHPCREEPCAGWKAKLQLGYFVYKYIKI